MTEETAPSADARWVDKARDAERQLAERDAEWRPTHRHVKTGGKYMLLGIGKMQAAGWFEVHTYNGHVESFSSIDMREVAIYRGVDGRMWARFREEFEDGRFVTIDAPSSGASVADAGWSEVIELMKAEPKFDWNNNQDGAARQRFVDFTLRDFETKLASAVRRAMLAAAPLASPSPKGEA